MELSVSVFLSVLVIEFFIFSCAGWVVEVVLKYFEYHRFINRGFLIGAYCPIYGCGVVVLTVSVGGMLGREGTLAEIFFAGMIICGALEYFTSWYMEKLFHARWWDYSQRPMNLHGRIWIGNLILFGAATVVIVRWVSPVLFSMLENWNPHVLIFIAVGIIIVIVADSAVSHFLMNVVKKTIDSQTGDSTEEISRNVHKLLKNRTMLLRRIHEAYPKMQARPGYFVEQLKEARRELKLAVKSTKTEMHHAALAARDRLQESFESTGKDWEAVVEAARLKQQAARDRLREIERRFFIHN